MFKKILKIILLLILLIIICINIPITHISHQNSTQNYNNWMNENINSNPNIVDIKMLGAHDAFSNEINVFSKIDPYADGIFNGFTGKILKGLLVRQSITQIADTKELLNSGVRYFDVRLTYTDNNWYTKHNYISEKFDTIAEDIVNYLDNYTGEFLILDFQHISGLDYDDKDDYLIYREMLDNFGLLSYNFTNTSKSLGEITYTQITNNKANSNVVIIDKFTYANKETYHYESSITSNWANSDDFDIVIQFLKDESINSKNTIAPNTSFKVMQAVTTMQSSASGFLNGLSTWSLLLRASKFNDYLITHNDFLDIMNSSPIVMVDYSNTNENAFLDNIMKAIIKANSETN